MTLAVVKLNICGDSQLVIEQIQKGYEAKDERMAHYLTLVQAGLAKLGEWVVKRVPQTENMKANALARVAATLPIKEAVLFPIYLQDTSSITTTSICSTIETDIEWMHEIVKCLRTGELLGKEKQGHKIRVQAACFTLVIGNLYRRSFGRLYIKCLSNPEA